MSHLCTNRLQSGAENSNAVEKMNLQSCFRTEKALADKTDRTPEEDDMLDMIVNGSERVKAGNLRYIIDWYDTAERGVK